MGCIRCGAQALAVSAVITAATVPAAAAEYAQRWLEPHEALPTTAGPAHSFPLPHTRHGPTTMAVALDGRIWFTESSGDRIGRMNPDGSGLTEFALPHAGSSPRIIARG